jgi:hypothetical protein
MILETLTQRKTKKKNNRKGSNTRRTILFNSERQSIIFLHENSCKEKEMLRKF